MDYRFCATCGAQRVAGARFCTKCGVSFPDEAGQTPTASGVPATSASGASSPDPATGRESSRALLVPVALVLIACLVLGATGTGWLLWNDRFGSGPDDVFVDVGSYAFKDPDPSRIVETEEWGELPANQVAIVLDDGLGPTDAERIAEEIGGEIVGHAELINLYQIETAGTTADDLKAALATAGAATGVEVSVPNIPVGARMTIEGRACSPLNDPMYSEKTNGRTYEMIGLQDAWDIIRASGVELNRTRVGVIDSIIYTESDQGFSPELHIPDAQGRHAAGKVRTIPLQRARDATATPLTESTGRLDMGGMGHGTAVTHVIAADTSGGTAGVAGILGEDLEVLVSVTGSGRTFVGGLDPDNPVQWHSWTYGHLEGMLEQIENGATVINCSWGPETLGSQNAHGSGMMRKFLRIMAERHPQVIFVAAAGNSGQGVTDSNDYWGKDLPNLVTVGALNHDGERATTRDWYEQEDLERAYQRRLAAGSIQPGTTLNQWIDSIQSGSNFADGGEITLSAPGTGVPLGIGPDGRTITDDGTSFSAPQVTGAIALIRSIDPSLDTAAIKRILTESAAREVTRGDAVTTVPANMGAGVLRVDAAVLQVINEMRAGPPDAEDYPRLPPLDRETLLGASRVTLNATKAPPKAGGSGQEWIVTAGVVGEGSVELQLATSGQGVVTGDATQRIDAPGEVSWKIDVHDKHFTVRVHRLDTNGCAVVELSDAGPDISGLWRGVAPGMGRSGIHIRGDLDVSIDFVIERNEDGEYVISSAKWHTIYPDGIWLTSTEQAPWVTESQITSTDLAVTIEPERDTCYSFSATITDGELMEGSIEAFSPAHGVMGNGTFELRKAE